MIVAKNLNLGCGKDYKQGWVNIDSRKEVSPDQVWNLDKPFPLNNNKADNIYCSHVIEHLCKPIDFIDECYRVLKPRGKLTIITPHFSKIDSMAELDHKRPGLGVMSFHFCIGKLHRGYYSKAKFSLKKVKIDTNNALQFLADLSPLKYEIFLCHIFPAHEITFELQKVSGLNE